MIALYLGILEIIRWYYNHENTAKILNYFYKIFKFIFGVIE